MKEVRSMLREEDIAIELKCQQYICKSYMRNLEGTESVLLFESTQKTEDVHMMERDAPKMKCGKSTRIELFCLLKMCKEL